MKKTIGILGGMGPEASSMLYRSIIQYAQRQYHAVQDSDYPPVLLNSITLTDFDETGIKSTDNVRAQLIKGVADLEKGGADFIVIACNTVHVLFDDMQKAVKIPIINIVAECVKEVKRSGIKKVGIFSSASTRRYRLYENALTAEGVTAITVSDAQQNILDAVIKNVMAGQQGSQDVLALNGVAKDFMEKGAQGIILGCTEIPLAYNQSHTNVPLFDTVEIITKKSVDFSFGSDIGK